MRRPLSRAPVSVSDLFKGPQNRQPFLLIFSEAQVAVNWLPGCSTGAVVIVYPAYKNKTSKTLVLLFAISASTG